MPDERQSAVRRLVRWQIVGGLLALIAWPGHAESRGDRDISASWKVGHFGRLGKVEWMEVEFDGPEMEAVRAVCVDGKHLAVEKNGISSLKPDGRIVTGLFSGSDWGLAPCEIEVGSSGEVACFDGAKTRAGRCQPPLEPIAPRSTKATVYGLRVLRQKSLLFPSAEVLRLNGRVVLGRSYDSESEQVSAVWRSRCGARESEEEVPFYFAPRAGEAWSVRAVLHQANRQALLSLPCSLRLTLRVRRAGTVLEEPLGAWCYSASGLKPGSC